MESMNSTTYIIVGHGGSCRIEGVHNIISTATIQIPNNIFIGVQENTGESLESVNFLRKKKDLNNIIRLYLPGSSIFDLDINFKLTWDKSTYFDLPNDTVMYGKSGIIPINKYSLVISEKKKSNSFFSEHNKMSELITTQKYNYKLSEILYKVNEKHPKKYYLFIINTCRVGRPTILSGNKSNNEGENNNNINDKIPYPNILASPQFLNIENVRKAIESMNKRNNLNNNTTSTKKLLSELVESLSRYKTIVKDSVI